MNGTRRHLRARTESLFRDAVTAFCDRFCSRSSCLVCPLADTMDREAARADQLARARQSRAAAAATRRAAKEAEDARKRDLALAPELLSEFQRDRLVCVTLGLVHAMSKIVQHVAGLRAGGLDGFAWPSADASGLSATLLSMQRGRSSEGDSSQDRTRQACLGVLLQWCVAEGLAAAFVRAADAGTLRFHQFEEHASYDEASFVLRTKEALQIADLPVVARGPRIPSVPSNAVGVSNTVKTAKVLQTRHHHAYLLSTPEPQALSDFVVVVVPVPSELQNLETTSTGCIFLALCESSTTSRAHCQAESLNRSVSVDRHASNLQSEKWIRRSRRACSNWKTLLCGCEVHMDATIHTKATRFLNCSVSGMVNVALSVATTADQQKLRRCVAEVILERMQVHVGDPGAEAEDFRRYAVHTFCPGEGNKVLRMVLLRCLPKGRWWLTDRVEI